MFLKSREPAAVATTTGELPKHSWAKSITWHLLPGVPIALVYTALAYGFQHGAGWPNVFALFVTVMFVEIPLLYFLILRFRRGDKGDYLPAHVLMPLRASQPLWIWLAIGIPVTVYSFMMNATLVQRLDGAVLSSLFNFLPEWYVLDFSGGGMMAVRESSPGVFYAFWIISVVGFIGGSYLQELYFRGVLLPRMPDAGIGTPLANALLFSIFHLTSPWAIAGRLLFLVPWSLIVWWRQSVNLGILMHVGMAIIGASIGAFFMFSN